MAMLQPIHPRRQPTTGCVFCRVDEPTVELHGLTFCQDCNAALAEPFDELYDRIAQLRDALTGEGDPCAEPIVEVRRASDDLLILTSDLWRAMGRRQTQVLAPLEDLWEDDDAADTEFPSPEQLVHYALCEYPPGDLIDEMVETDTGGLELLRQRLAESA